MRNAIKYLIAVVFCFLTVGTSVSAYGERSWLVTRPDQLSTASDNNPGDIGNLADNNAWTSWESNPTRAAENYIDIRLDEPIKLQSDEDLVVYLRRHGDDDQIHPTIFHVQGSVDGKIWSGDKMVYIYMLYRGPWTEEYSARIHTPELETDEFQYIRLTVVANNTKTVVGSSEYRRMKLSEINILRLKHTDNYSEKLVDRFRLTTDYSHNHAGYDFENSLGILDSHNRVDMTADWGDINGWDGGTWTKDADYLKSIGVEMPDYTYRSSSNDSDVKTGVRQATHVTEHTLYAVPGDVIALYPYYDMPTNGSYHENFSHWYDYETGGRLKDAAGNDLLDFLIDPSRIIRTKDHGFFGGTSMVDPNWVEINNESDYIYFANLVNSGQTTLNAVLTANIEFTQTPPMIGTPKHPYAGIFEGNGYYLNSLNISGGDQVGVFGTVTDGAVIRGVCVGASCSITGDKYVGVIGVYYGNEDGELIIEDCVCDPKITASGVNAGGLLGCNFGYGAVKIINCGFIGDVKGGSESALLSGWMGSNSRSCIINSYALDGKYDRDTSSGFEYDGNEKYKVLYRGTASVDNVYTDVQSSCQGTVLSTSEMQDSGFARRLGNVWYYETWGQAPPVKEWNYCRVYAPTSIHPNRFYGTVATFFQPRDITIEEGLQHNLEKDEYVIAADFAQDYRQNNMVEEGSKIIEPVINFRHIFRIRDGKKFADENMADVAGNRAFVHKNMRYVSARAGVNFQIRFDSPVPVEGTTRSKWYYKISDTDYRRICSQKIRVYDADTEKEIPNPGFYPYEEFDGQGMRSLEGYDYYLCGGGGSYYRMLRYDNPNPGRYIVRLIGCDVNGNEIKLADHSGESLWVQEYRITFLPDMSASFLTEEELAQDKYSTHRPEYLERAEICGDPNANVDYDQYRLLDNSDAVENPDDYLVEMEDRGKYYRWPVPWDQSNYAFGYHARHDYNMYMLTNNSLNTPYHGGDDAPAVYDRRYYDTEGRDQGYFYYVNAAADPGVMARLTLDDLCVGSTVTVSAWAIEFSGAETCNLAFNFIAVKKGGDRVPLHTFVTGYVPEESIGKWMHIYYSFIPDLIDFDSGEVDHYEFELDNNCKNSGGADYAIDDIRVYVIKPQIFATQTFLMCEASETTDIRVETPFDVLLQALGITPATSADNAETIDVYYTFYDKELYETLRDEEGAALEAHEAFEQSQLIYNYDINGGDDQRFGCLTFKTFFAANPAYTGNEQPGDAGSSYVDEAGQRLIVFNTKPKDSSLRVGKEYGIALWLPSPLDPNHTTNPGYNEFQIEDGCAKIGSFKVQGTGLIKVDGEVYYDDDPIEVCENQSPVVQVDLYGRNESGEIVPLMNNARFDWFSGGVSKFKEAVSPGNKPLKDILTMFRAYYPYAEDTDVEPVGNNLTQEDLDYIASISTQPEDGSIPELVLSKSSYVFPPVTIPENQTETYVSVAAIPIDYVIDNKLKVCTEPKEITIAVRNHSPLMGDGFDGVIEYPSNLNDVPLRIGLRQLKSVSAPVASMASATTALSMPLRSIHPATTGVSRFAMAENKDVTLVETNDPAYSDLSDGTGLITAGLLVGITADRNRNDNLVRMVFDDSMRFKEGYYYRLRFDYREDIEGVELPDNVDASAVCNGQLVFTIKVVPEYQKWTGAVNNNWNNDDNWSRVSAADILRAENDADEYVTGSANDNTVSYAPLDFTKVLIPYMGADASAGYPMMFAEQNTSLTISGNSYLWSSDADEADAGEATSFIVYDMASNEASGGISCRPWYANTCGRIHFDAGARMYRQNFFTHYNRAWVDLQTAPSRWYTLSSPLQSVVAGDMYLPTATGSQNTELFKEISFNTNDYDRFRPAVFQRSWNKASAIVYELPGSAEASRNVAVSTTWSNVFNDVAETYPAGEGFSVKTDLSATSLSNDVVKFRLPKDDSEYLYYDFSGNIQGNRTAISRTNAYKLNPTDFEHTVSAAASGEYFLVGNPFITRLDMAEFLQENADAVEPAYWILSGNAQTAAVWDPIEGAFFGTVADAPSVGVGQGFFVKKRTPAQSLTVKFTSRMLYEGDFGSADVQPLSRAAASAAALEITALCNGAEQSKALLRISESASAAYKAGEDAATVMAPELGIAATVYTAAEHKAMTVNTVPAIEETEVGVLTDGDNSVTLRFGGELADAGYKLLDTADGSLNDIYDGFEYVVGGSASGRLYIVTDAGMPGTDGLSIYLNNRTVTVSSTRGEVHAEVFNTLGMPAGNYCDGENSVSFSLEPGVWLVSGSDNEGRCSRMVMVR